MPFMQVPKRGLRQEYRLRQRERVEASPLLGNRFPRLKGLKVTLEFFDQAGSSKQGGLQCKLNVQHANSALWFDCPGAGCVGGDFDLTEALAEAVAEGHKVATGELRCQGTRTRGKQKSVACGTLLRYKLNLSYE